MVRREERRLRNKVRKIGMGRKRSRLSGSLRLVGERRVRKLRLNVLEVVRRLGRKKVERVSYLVRTKGTNWRYEGGIPIGME